MFNDPSSVTIGPDSLPVTATRPFTVAGNQLLVTLAKGSTVKEGQYGITFEVKNPSKIPFDCTWKLQANKGNVVKFVEVLPGYHTYGQKSPKEVMTSVVMSGAERRLGSSLLMMLSALLVSVAGTLIF